jgi:hypothetical protein
MGCILHWLTVASFILTLFGHQIVFWIGAFQLYLMALTAESQLSCNDQNVILQAKKTCLNNAVEQTEESALLCGLSAHTSKDEVDKWK